MLYLCLVLYQYLTNYAANEFENRIFEEITGITDKEIEEFNETINTFDLIGDEEIGDLDLNLLQEEIDNLQRENQHANH